jgi:tripeptidyl-peptidase-1
MIQPTTHFGRATPYQVGGEPTPIPAYGPGSATKLNATYCNTTTPPDCIRALYKIGEFKANSSSGVKLGISGFNYQQAVHSDLSLFRDKWAPMENKTGFKVVTSNGGVNNETGALVWAPEANLDIQYGVSLAYGIPATFYKTGGFGPLIPDLQQPNGSDSLLVQEPFLEHLQFLLNLTQEDLPTVLSISYGEDEQSHPVSYMKSVCQLFAKLGARGVSVIVSR